MELRNKRVLVTGADGGIGSAVSRQLARAGCDLVLCSNQQASLQQLGASLGASGIFGTVKTVTVDIASAKERNHLASVCEADGGIDCLVNLAGILDFRLFENQPDDVIERMLAINMLSPMLLCKEFLPQLKRKPEAIVLNVGSIFGSIGHPGFVAYCASKAGMKTFSEALARELADTPVRVAYIAPRATATALNSDKVNEMNRKLGNRMDTPEYVARQIVAQLRNGKLLNYLGWPEKLFVRVNALIPSIVHKALVKNLGLIKEYAGS